ncbi:hypothetical protein B7463_g2105, partial [Scytalidium lignicola]
LSYGQLGEASYDPHEKEWHFSRQLTNDRSLVQLLPFRCCINSSVNNFPETEKEQPRHATKQLRWLMNAHPEIFPGNNIASSFIRDESAVPSDTLSPESNLLAVGRALDADHMSGSRVVRILALPEGEAGNVLRLIRPGVEMLGWKERDGVRISLMNPSLSTDGYWMGSHGPIRQIVPSSEDGSATWFAVRQDTVITVFRPVYRKTVHPAAVPKKYRNTYPPSRLTPNPISILQASDSGSRTHVDVSFNPWFTRQFGVIDERGAWSLWIMEGRRTKHSIMEISPGKTGKIYDNNVHQSSDGWHRILWIANVNTIIVCGRRHLAVFDIKSKPTLLNSLDFNVLCSKFDRILDLKRSVTNPNHVFILTTSRIFWIRVTPAGEGEDETSQSVGARVLLSCRHYRDADGKAMKVVVPADEHVSVILFSETSLLVNYYSFFITSGTIMRPECLQGSVMLSIDSDDTRRGRSKRLHTLHMEPAPFKMIPSAIGSAEGLSYIEKGFKFYQLLCVWSDRGVSSSLCGIDNTAATERLNLLPPTISFSRGRPVQSSREILDNPFIVPDWINDVTGERPSSPYQVMRNMRSIKDKHGLDDMHLRINLNRVFGKVFVQIRSSSNQSANLTQNMKTILNRTAAKVQQGIRDGQLPMATLLELSGTSEFTDDLSQASDILRDFSQTLLAEQSPAVTTKLILSDLRSGSLSHLLSLKDPDTWPDLLRIYDLIIDNWVSCLPRSVSNKARGVKFRIIRRMTAELCLSSVAVSLHQILLPSATQDHDNNGLQTLDIQDRVDNDSSPNQSHSLQLPLRTVNQSNPSLVSNTGLSPNNSSYSYGTLASAPEAIEDPSITRLRSYVVSIKPSQDLIAEKSTLLSHWPASPQADPTHFMWKADISASSPTEEENQEESDSRSQASSRARRRFEDHLSRTPSRSRESTSQLSRQFGSQREETLNIFSSQTMDNFPMSQPDRGAFGSRSARPSSKKKKKVASGFR